MKKCTNCGAELSDDSLFCASCGTPVKKDEEQEVKVDTEEIIAGQQDYAEDKSNLTEEIEDSQIDEQIGDTEDIPVSVPPVTPPAAAETDTEPLPYVMPPVTNQEDWTAPPNPQEFEHGKKGKGKVIAIVLIILVAIAAIAAAIFITKPFDKKSGEENNPVIYRRDDGVLRYIATNKKTPVTVCDDYDFDYSSYGSIAIDKKESKIAYINRYGELFVVPVKEMSTDEDHPSNKDYKVSDDVDTIYGFDSTGKKLFYANEYGDFYSFDGQEPTRIDRDVVLAYTLDNDDVLYMRGEAESSYYGYGMDAEVSVYIETSSKKKPEKIKVTSAASGMYDVYTREISGKTFIYFLEGDEEIKDLKRFDVKSQESEVVIKDVGRVLQIGDSGEVLYLRYIGEDMKEYADFTSSYFDPYKIEFDICYYENGEETTIAKDANDYIRYAVSDDYIIYSKETGDKEYTTYYQNLHGEPQKISRTDEYKTVSILITDTKKDFLFLENNFDDEDQTRSGSTLYYCPVSDRGVLGEPVKLDEDVYTFYHGEKQEQFFYTKNPDSTSSIVDLYRTDGKETTEIARDVDFMSIGAIINQYDDVPMFYMKDLDSRRRYGDLVMYSNNKETEIAKEMPISDGSIPVFYRAENEIYLIQNYSERIGTGDLYVYKGKDKLELVDYDVSELLPPYFFY